MVDTGRSPAPKQKGTQVVKSTLIYAQVVKLVDTLASGASARKGVEVQVLSWAPNIK